MVRLAGIEPTTPWFVAKYSIQLSYSRAALEYSSQVPKIEHREPLDPLRRACGCAVAERRLR